LGLSLCYQGLEGIWQRFRYNMERVPGTLDDSNSLSVFFCTTAPLFVAAVNSRLPKLLKWVSAAAIGLAYIGVLLTVCRTGFVVILSVIVLTTALTISMRLTAQKVVFGVLIAIVGSAVTARSWESLQARFSQANLKVEFGKNRSLGRGYYLRVAKSIMDDRFFGVGLNNWSYWVSQKYGPSLGYRFVHYKGTDVEPSTAIPTGSNVDEAQAAPAHSLGALTAGEMGIPGLVLFGLLWLRWFQMGASFLWTRTPDPMRRIGVGLAIGLLGIFLHSLTEWVFRQSPIYYVIHILLCALASLYYLKRQQARQAIVEESRELEPKVWAEPSAVHA